MRRLLTSTSRRIIQVHGGILPQKVKGRAADRNNEENRSLVVDNTAVCQPGNEQTCAGEGDIKDVITEHYSHGLHADLDVIFAVLDGVDGIWQSGDLATEQNSLGTVFLP